MLSPLIVIAGPTASGKSAFAMEIAQKYNGEIICADSRTVYKGLNIGTAKPSLNDQKLVRHHLLDVVEPNQSFTAADFKRLAMAAIDDIAARGKLPIMVGGTGMYIDAVIFDYTFGPKGNPAQRAKLQELSVAELQQICIDRGIPLPINARNKRHLVRAIELGRIVEEPKKLRSDTLVVAITTDKATLKLRIAARAQEMVRQGILGEVAAMASRYGWDAEALTGNIYRTLRPVVEGTTTLDEGIDQFIMSDMQLAKRQLTWLRRNPYITWGTPEQLSLVIEHFVQQINLAESIPGAS